MRTSLLVVAALPLHVTPGLVAAPAEAVGQSVPGGRLVGRVVLQGEVPFPRPLHVTKDHHVFGKRPVDESLVVGPGGGLASVVVLLQAPQGQELPPVRHAAKVPVVLHIRNGRFEPRIAVVQVGQEMEIVNHDPVPHNPSVVLPGGGFDWLRFPLEPRPRVVFRRGSSVPVPVVCHIHPWMRGYVVVSPHPWVAVTGKDGRFDISHVPPGVWRVRLWHERGGFLLLPDWPRSGKRITIQAAETTHLGTIGVPREKLLRQTPRKLTLCNMSSAVPEPRKPEKADTIASPKA